MDLTSKSTIRTLDLAELAHDLAFELEPELCEYWRRIDERVGAPDAERQDFGPVIRRFGEMLRSLKAQLLMAAIAAELDPGRRSLRKVRQLQQRTTKWLRHLRDLFLLSRYDDEAEKVDPKRTYFRPIAGLAPSSAKTIANPRAAELAKAIRALDPKALLEAHLGLMAIANFPNRPPSLQQQRRKKRRRRRSGPGAPSGSFRRNRGEEEEDEE